MAVRRTARPPATGRDRRSGGPPPGTPAALPTPPLWAPPHRPPPSSRRLVPRIRSPPPTPVPPWPPAAVRGAATLPARPNPAAGVAACLLATTVETAAAHGDLVRQLVAAARQALSDTDDPDQAPPADPLPITATLLRDSYARASSHELAARFAVATFSTLAQADKDTVTRVVLE